MFFAAIAAGVAITAPCVKVPHPRVPPLIVHDDIVLMPLHLVTVTPSNFFTKYERAKIASFGDALVRSNWLREVTKEYRHGSFDKMRHTHVDGDAFAFSKPKAATVESYLFEQLRKARIPFEDNAVYALMVPVGSAVRSNAGGTPEGFHHEFQKTQQLDAWAVIQPDDKAFNLDTYTVVIAHETAEAITHTAGHGVSGRAFGLRWTGSVEAVDAKKNLAGMVEPDVSPAKLELGHNVPAQITVTIPAGTPAKSWGIVLVTSKRPDAPRGTDKQHEWYYGVFYDP